jgi:hypothetical protein
MFNGGTGWNGLIPIYVNGATGGKIIGWVQILQNDQLIVITVSDQ